MDTDTERQAVRILEDLRKGHHLSDEIMQAAGSVPLIDHIRRHVEEADRELLFSLMRSERAVDRRFGGTAIYRIQTPDDTQKVFEIWSKEDDFFVRESMIYTLLNKPGHISADQRRLLLNFLEQHEEKYAQGLRRFYGENAVEKILARLKDPIHESKRCLYIHSLGVLGDRSAVGIIKGFMNDPDPVVQEQWKRALKKLEASA
jgi:hypothetical protein